MNNCEICSEEINTKFKLTITAKYCGSGGVYNRVVCKKCMSLILDIPIERIDYFEQVVNFRKSHKLGFDDNWTPKHISKLWILQNLKKF